MGPLDMTGFVGAATVTGCLLYGAGHALHGEVNFDLHDGTIVDSPIVIHSLSSGSKKTSERQDASLP